MPFSHTIDGEESFVLSPGGRGACAPTSYSGRNAAGRDVVALHLPLDDVRRRLKSRLAQVRAASPPVAF
jgi:hypothetical protein